MQEVAFVKQDGVVEVAGIARSISIPEFVRAYDTEMSVGQDYASPKPRSIQAAELTMDVSDPISNETLFAYVETAMSQARLVTLMIIRIQVEGNKSVAIGEFFSGYVNRPNRNITPDASDTGTIRLQIDDCWRTRNGVQVWRLPKKRSSVVDVAEIYSP